MLETFNALIDLSHEAKNKRLNESVYRKVMLKHTESSMRSSYYGKQSVRGLLLKLPFMLRIALMLRGFHKSYASAVIYSDSLLNDFEANTEEYRCSFELLSDDWSKRLFINLLAGEMLMDARYGVPFQEEKLGCPSYYCVDLPNCGDRSNEPFIKAGEIIVDCGCFDGDTLREFINEGKAPLKYIGFEPDPVLFIKAQRTLSASGLYGVVHKAGLSKTSGYLRFESKGSAGRVSEDGDISIRVLSIDDVIKEPVTLIKMDIEGSECEALEGATSLISKHKPKLAIACYHKFTDFRRIPLLIKRLNGNYSSFYIRYLCSRYIGACGFTETVLFAR